MVSGGGSEIQKASENAGAIGDALGLLGEVLGRVSKDTPGLAGVALDIVGGIVGVTGTIIGDMAGEDARLDAQAKKEANERAEADKKSQTPPPVKGGAKTPNPDSDEGVAGPALPLAGVPVIKAIKKIRNAGSPNFPGGLPPDGWVEAEKVKATGRFAVVDPLWDPQRVSFSDPDSVDPRIVPPDVDFVMHSKVIVCYVGAGLNGMVRMVGPNKLVADKIE